MSIKNEITIDGVEYIRKDQAVQVYNTEGLKFCIVRTYGAGVFAGYFKLLEGKAGFVYDAIRLWSWSGAASLSQIAMEGVKNSDDCKFAMKVPEIFLTEIIEVIPVTEKAKTNIESVPTWKV